MKGAFYYIAALLCVVESTTGIDTDVQSLAAFLDCLMSSSLDVLTPASQDWNEVITPYVLPDERIVILIGPLTFRLQLQPSSSRPFHPISNRSPNFFQCSSIRHPLRIRVRRPRLAHLRRTLVLRIWLRLHKWDSRH